MISTQHVDPIYRPPANHLLRMIYAKLMKLRCLITCEGTVEVVTQPLTLQLGAYDIITPDHYGMTAVSTTLIGPNLDASLVVVKITKEPSRIILRLYNEDEEDQLLIRIFPPDTNDLDFDYIGTLVPGLTHFAGVIQNVVTGPPPETPGFVFELEFAPVPGVGAPPTLILPANPFAESTVIRNTGDILLDILEEDAMIATLAPGEMKELPMPGLLRIYAKVSMFAAPTAGDVAEVEARRRLRCACGDVIVIPEPEPEGAPLV